MVYKPTDYTVFVVQYPSSSCYSNKLTAKMETCPFQWLVFNYSLFKETIPLTRYVVFCKSLWKNIRISLQKHFGRVKRLITTSASWVKSWGRKLQISDRMSTDNNEFPTEEIKGAENCIFLIFSQNGVLAPNFAFWTKILLTRKSQ